ncbi:MAG: GldG family protein [Blastocatellia bacterium]
MELSRKELFKYLGTFGLALLVITYLWYSTTEVLGKLKGALMIAGALMILVALAANFNELVAAMQKRSTRLGANSALVILAALAIFGFVNFLGYRHHKKFDLTAEKLYSLSDQTIKVVSGLQKDVKVYYFNKTDEPVADEVEKYRYYSKHLTYERVDLQARPEMASQFRGIRPGETVVAADNRTEKLTTVDEQSLTSALMKVTREKAKTVCFVEGHGEHEISGGGSEGYQGVDTKLKGDNYNTKSINLVTTNAIPEDCSVLVLGGPKKALLAPEADLVKKFLNDGGKAMVALDPEADPELSNLVKDWGIEVRQDTVIDTSGVGRLFGTGPAVPLVVQYGPHAITKDFGRNSMTFFPLARSIKAESNGEVTVTDLLKTSESSFGETDLKGNEAKFDEGKDTKGPLTLGVAATKKIGAKEARLVVIGDSDFAANGYQRSAANGDLFVNSVNWLAQEEDLISIRPKSQTNRDVQLTSTAQNLLFWLTMILPIAVIGAGIQIWWKRR